jgi:hypothetical protein
LVQGHWSRPPGRTIYGRVQNEETLAKAGFFTCIGNRSRASKLVSSRSLFLGVTYREVPEVVRPSGRDFTETIANPDKAEIFAIPINSDRKWPEPFVFVNSIQLYLDSTKTSATIRNAENHQAAQRYFAYPHDRFYCWPQNTVTAIEPSSLS